MKTYIAKKYEKMMNNDDDLRELIGHRAEEGKVNKLFQLKTIIGNKQENPSKRWPHPISSRFDFQ